jgi:hypothetical protein
MLAGFFAKFRDLGRSGRFQRVIDIWPGLVKESPRRDLFHALGAANNLSDRLFATEEQLP